MNYKIVKYILAVTQTANDEWNIVCNSHLKNIEGTTYYRYMITEEIGKFQKKISRRFREEKIDFNPVLDKMAEISDNLQPQVDAIKAGIKTNLVKYVAPQWHDILASVSTTFLLLNLADSVLKGAKFETQFSHACELIQRMCDSLSIEYWKSGNIMENVSIQPINNNILQEIKKWK